MDGGVVGVEETLNVVSESEYVCEIGINHSTVAHDGNAVTGMLIDQFFDSTNCPLIEIINRFFVNIPLALEHGLPTGVVGGFEFFHGNVFIRVAIPFGNIVDESHSYFLQSGEGSCSLLRTTQRTCIHCIDLFRCEVLSQMLCLQ